MKRNRGLTLWELIAALAVIGLVYVLVAGIVRRGKLKNSLFKKKVVQQAPVGGLNTLHRSPWIFPYSNLPQVVQDYSDSFSTWNQLTEQQRTDLKNEVGPKLGLSASDNWAILCDRISYGAGDQTKLKCNAAGGFVVAILPRFISQQRSNFSGGHWGLPAGTQILVTKNDSSTYRFTKPFDNLLVGMWSPPGSSTQVIVFRTLEGQASEPKVRLFIENEEWETEAQLVKCEAHIGRPFLLEKGTQCMVGSSTDLDGTPHQMGYEYLFDWYDKLHQRPTLGGNPITLLTLTDYMALQPTQSCAAGDTSCQQGMEGAQKAQNDGYREKCQSTDNRVAGMACYQLARLAEHAGDLLEMRLKAESACDKGHGYSCNWRAEMAAKEKSTSDIDRWCRRAQDLNYYSGGVCSAYRPVRRR